MIIDYNIKHRPAFDHQGNNYIDFCVWSLRLSGADCPTASLPGGIR